MFDPSVASLGGVVGVVGVVSHKLFLVSSARGHKVRGQELLKHEKVLSTLWVEKSMGLTKTLRLDRCCLPGARPGYNDTRVGAAEVTQHKGFGGFRISQGLRCTVPNFTSLDNPPLADPEAFPVVCVHFET